MDLQADSFRWMEDSGGTWLCLRTTRREAMQVCNELKQDTTHNVTIKQERKKRSLDSNAYAWVLMDKLAEKLRKPKTEIYREYIKDIGGNSETVCVLEKAAKKLCDGWSRNGLGWQTDQLPSKLDGCVNVVLYYGSSTYDTEQMSRLIDLIVEDCKLQGIETLPPDKLALLVEEWGGKRDA